MRVVRHHERWSWLLALLIGHLDHVALDRVVGRDGRISADHELPQVAVPLLIVQPKSSSAFPSVVVCRQGNPARCSPSELTSPPQARSAAIASVLATVLMPSRVP
jgi:hypothetical protein